MTASWRKRLVRLHDWIAEWADDLAEGSETCEDVGALREMLAGELAELRERLADEADVDPRAWAEGIRRRVNLRLREEAGVYPESGDAQ